MCKNVDTLVVKDSVYVEKVHEVEVRDTVRVVVRDSVPYPVEVPVPVEVEKTIAPFCRWSTAILWIAIVVIVAWRILKRNIPQARIVATILSTITKIRAPV